MNYFKTAMTRFTTENPLAHMTPGRRKPLLFLLLLVLPLVTLPAISLDVTVLDRDLEIPLEGVRITETNTGARAVTDFDGTARLNFTPPAGRAVLVAELIGYEPRRLLVKDFTDPIQMEMVIEGVLEGEELVVEEEAIGETDETVGVSTVIENDMIRATSVIGPIEDLMQSIKLLPGVTYGGPFGAFLSVRGGEPGGLTHVIDGFLVQFPYHFGGAFSIFNPNIVDSVKFSAGLFPMRYGQATSGLMEVNTIVPNDGFQWSYVQSTSTFEAFTQLPFAAGDAGLFAGARLTNYDLALALTGGVPDDSALDLNRVPYFYDFYFKTFYRPSERFEWFLNATNANDGTGLKLNPPEEGIANTFGFNWYNGYTYANTGASGLIGDRLLLEGIGGYEYWRTLADGSFSEFGTSTYPESFLSEFEDDPFVGPTLAGLSEESEFSINFDSDFDQVSNLHAVQGRVDAEYLLTDGYFLQGGLGGLLNLTRFDATGNIWGTFATGDEPHPEYRLLTVEAEGSNTDILNSFTYLNLNAEPIPKLLEGDLGLRLDHSYYQSGDYSLNTLPTLAPRLSVRLTPESDNALFQEHTFSAGVGLLSKSPFENSAISPDLGLEDFEVPITKTLLSILGWETRFPRGYRFRLEGYHKYVYDRFYFNFVTEENDAGEIETVLKQHTDGIGHAAGFDILFDRRTSRYVDGMLSYSFVYARYKNPQTDGLENAENQSPPLGKWYFPSFHRYHTLNLVANVKPWPWFTLTSVLTFATGAPVRGIDDDVTISAVKVTEMTPEEGSPDKTVAVEDPFYVPQYGRSTFYSDDLRGNISVPLDLKASVHYYWPDRKIYTEAYVAVEDVLARLISRLQAQTDAVTVDQWTGEVIPDAQEGTLSFIIPSLGFRLSY